MEFNLESMKEKIFNALKQKYSNLGLGDETLQSVAESLASTGLVTDENLDTVVAGQGVMLKGYQSTFDRMRTENANYKKEIETLKGNGGDQKKTEPTDEEPGWFKAYREEQEKKINALTEENEKAKAEKAKAERKDLILNKAKEAGIPEWRINEGFAISEDADENAIKTYMDSIKQNIVTNSLEGKETGTIVPKGEASKEDAEAVLAAMGM